MLARPYLPSTNGRERSVPVTPPGVTEIQQCVECISQRVGRHLDRRGLLIRDAESAYLDRDGEQVPPLADLAGHSIANPSARGSHAVRN